MNSKERFSPIEKNLGKDCAFWNNKLGCFYPKIELEGRRSCEGVVDDVCLFIKDGRTPKSLSKGQILELKLRVPDPNKNIDIPPGDIQ